MKNQSLILIAVFSLITTFAKAQSVNKKNDSVSSARRIILKNSGEKNLGQQIRKDQVSSRPESLRPDSSNTPVDTKRTKGRSNKQNKEGK